MMNETPPGTDKVTLDKLAKYFANVEDRLEAGSLSPMSNEGNQVLDQLIDCFEQVKAHAADAETKARSFDSTGRAFDEYLDLIDMKTRMALLMGKFVGFRMATHYITSRAGSYGSEIN